MAKKNPDEKTKLFMFADRANGAIYAPDEVAGRVFKAWLKHEKHNIFDRETQTVTNDFDPHFEKDTQEYDLYQDIINGTEQANLNWIKTSKANSDNARKRWDNEYSARVIHSQSNGNTNLKQKECLNVNANINATDNGIYNVIRQSAKPEVKSLYDMMTDDEIDDLEQLFSPTDIKEVLDRIDTKLTTDEIKAIKNPKNYFLTTAKNEGYLPNQ